MKIAMFGATGRVGSVLLEQALAAGHDVHVLSRTSARMDRSGQGPTITLGDAKDAAIVDTVVAGSDAVLSTLGGVRGPDSLSAGTNAIIAAMGAHGVRRLILVQGFHLTFPGDHTNIGHRLIVPIMRLYYSDILTHSNLMAAALQRSDIEWTLVRIPRIVRRPAHGNLRHGRLKLGPWSTVTASDVAAFVLDCLTSGRFVREAPMVAS
jgi:putative NADH-flavin reductase